MQLGAVVELLSIEETLSLYQDVYGLDQWHFIFNVFLLVTMYFALLCVALLCLSLL